MKTFVLKSLIILIIASFFVTLSFVLPPTNVSKKYLLFAQIDKNKLLANTPGRRVIFVGGSNLTFGLNSGIIKDSLNINPINTGLHAGIGLKYMLSNTLRFVRENDIVVLAPEYHQFYGKLADGRAELLTMIIDVSPETRNLSASQYLKLIPFIPEYSCSKLRLWNYLKKTDSTVISIHDRKSFNTYGDGYLHWNMHKQSATALEPIKGQFNEDVFASLDNFRTMVNLKKAKLLVTYPCFQDVSFKHSIAQIRKIEKRLKSGGFVILGTPERYMIADSLTFDTPYHLVKEGVDLRTTLLVEDLKKQVARPSVEM